MKILWLINVPIPQIAQDAGIKAVPFGGWLVQLADRICQYPDLQLYIVFKQTERKEAVVGTANKIRYYGFYQDVFKTDTISEEHLAAFSQIVEKEQPDVIHIFGTEHLHSYEMIQVCKKYGRLDRVLVTIQGLISVYAKHYYADIPLHVRYGYSIRDVFRGNVRAGKKLYIKKGKYEISVLSQAKNAAGRTDWDEACVRQINPAIRYFHNNEILRKGFYQNRWEFDKCKKHTIFCSQTAYPIKGFHYVLDAFPEILKEYPDAEIYASGEDFRKKSPLKQTLYQKYLLKKIERGGFSGAIHFLGQLDEAHMVQAYLNSNVFVCPSSIENSPNSLGEAMLLGVPVVAADVGGVKNMLTHEQEGFVYQHDAPYMLAYYVKKVFALQESILPMTECAREHALKTHDAEKNTKELYEIYQEIAR